MEILGIILGIPVPLIILLSELFMIFFVSYVNQKFIVTNLNLTMILIRVLPPFHHIPFLNSIKSSLYTAGWPGEEFLVKQKNINFDLLSEKILIVWQVKLKFTPKWQFILRTNVWGSIDKTMLRSLAAHKSHKKTLGFSSGFSWMKTFYFPWTEWNKINFIMNQGQQFARSRQRSLFLLGDISQCILTYQL